MRFLDANVFIYAFSKPARFLDATAVSLKKKAAQILRELEDGCTSVVHLSEAANVIADLSGEEHARNAMSAILDTPSIHVLGVSREDYALAVELSSQSSAGVNDCLAVMLMHANGIKEIYSFDREFDSFAGITRLEE